MDETYRYESLRRASAIYRSIFNLREFRAEGYVFTGAFNNGCRLHHAMRLCDSTSEEGL